MSNELLPDIYKISDTVNEIQTKFMEDIDQDTLTMSTFGYMNSMFSNILQNAIIMASEWGNEAFPIRAKFEKSIITNAITYNINDINATPAKMEVMIGFIKDELDAQFNDSTFILDKECSFSIGEFEFHLDYDIIITKDIVNNETIYAARYDIDRENPLSDITNPYLAPPVQLNINNDNFIFINCIIRQVELSKLYSKIISTNILDNKTFDFEFESQLADFDVIVKEGDNTYYLEPIFEGMPTNSVERYCYYTFLDSNTIRIKFDRNSYEPKLNSDIEIHLKTTQGSKGVFSYKDDIINGLQSERFNYGNLVILMKPVTDSEYGIDKKSINDLKQIIPKEILSRGNITNNKDIENYFNTLDDNRLLFYRRRDNQFERLYYAYMLVKDDNNNIIPTNTIDLEITEREFNNKNDNRHILNAGNVFHLDGQTGVANVNNTLTENEIINLESESFLYTCPYLCVVNRDPLSVSYYLNILDDNYYFRFSYINNNSILQFISTSLNISKPYKELNLYKLSMDIMQNMNIDKNLIEFDDYGNIINSKIKPVLIIHADNDYEYYIHGKVTSMDKDLFKYSVEFELETDNTIDYKNRIKINNIFNAGTFDKTYVYLNREIDISIGILVEFDEEYGRDTIDSVIPGLEGYTLCNKYDVPQKINLFYNYSNIIKSTVKVVEGNNGLQYFKIKGIPSVRYSYLNDPKRCSSFIDYIQYRKVYIDDAIKVLEDSFNVDFKFFNTYGPSKMFLIGHNNETIDKVNLSFRFKVKLKVGASKYAKEYITEEIKNYVEDINNIRSIHMSNLITYLTNKFESDLEYIEFLGLNKYDALNQYLEKIDTEIIEDVPEFLNINLTKDLKPDIEIILV